MKTNPTRLPIWSALQRRAGILRNTHLRDLFATDPQRFAHFSREHDGWLLDFSKQRVDRETWELLLQLANDAGIASEYARALAGEAINHSEQRAVLHMALRAAPEAVLPTAGTNAVPAVHAVLARMRRFCEQVHDGSWRGFSGERITDVVNLGIGGSDLGPRMAARALAAWRQPDLRVHFVANVDGADLASTLAHLNPRSTLFVVASKTFTTAETMANAGSARAWLLAAAGNQAAVARHFVAVSTNLAATADFGIAPENVFEFWDWVGGRFSLWSAIGLPLALAIGFRHFEALLAGARAMDQHFRDASPTVNLPLTLALLELWNTNFLGAASHAVLPYSQSLELLPAHLQQLQMESLGKQVDRDGQPTDYATAPVLWGAAGTNGQHSFYQLLHQGGWLIPCDFIALKHADFPLAGHHTSLLANCLAQSAALAFGRTAEETRASGTPEALVANKTFHGNQPSTTLLLERLDPHTLGRLIALYEHKVFCLGVLWHLNAFDQWGVELGKQLAASIAPQLDGSAQTAAFDGSTRGLIAALRR